MADKIPSLTEEQAYELMRTLLEEWPLYRPLQAHINTFNPAIPFRTDFPIPGRIQYYCSHPSCHHATTWDRTDSRGTGFVTVHAFRCRNCQETNIFFALAQFRYTKSGACVATKVGQYPEMESKPPKEAREYLGHEYDFYRKALRLRNGGDGIGAVSYLRRIVENRMDEILALEAEAVRESGGDETTLKRIEEVRTSRRFDDKIKVANEVLPTYLRPSGLPNPFDIFHDLTSDGLHRRSEEECIALFDTCRAAFELFFKRLKVHRDEARAYAEELKKLTAKRNVG